MSLPVLKRRVGAATTAAVEAIVNRHVSSYFSALYSRPVSGPSFLGIDVSLRTTGFAVLDNKGVRAFRFLVAARRVYSRLFSVAQGTVLDVGAIRRSSDWDVLDCGSGISSKLAALATQFPCIKVICLEEFMKSFAVGK